MPEQQFYPVTFACMSARDFSAYIPGTCLKRKHEIATSKVDATGLLAGETVEGRLRS